MLTSRAVYAEVSSVLELLGNGELDLAKKRLQALAPEAKTERERGSILAASGICASLAKGKDGGMQTWDRDRTGRALASITTSQMADDLDKGYAETLENYSKLTEKKV